MRDELSAYVEGALPEATQAAVARHLASCPACQAEAEASRQAEEALRSLAAVTPAPDLTADLRRRLSAAAPRRSPRWAWAAAALAAAALAALALQARRAPAPPPRAIVKSPAPTGNQPQQMAVQPVTDRGGAPRPTSPPHPSPAAVHTGTARPPAHASSASLHTASPPPQAWGGGRGVRALSPANDPSGEDAVPVPVPRPEPAQAFPAVPDLSAEVRLRRTETRDPRPETRPSAPAVILLLSPPHPSLPAANCRVEVSLPDGSSSVREQIAAPDAAGEERVVRVTYRTTEPNQAPEWRLR